jgi:hypothetical protein
MGLSVRKIYSIAADRKVDKNESDMPAKDSWLPLFKLIKTDENSLQIFIRKLN